MIFRILVKIFLYLIEPIKPAKGCVSKKLGVGLVKNLVPFLGSFGAIFFAISKKRKTFICIYLILMLLRKKVVFLCCCFPAVDVHVLILSGKLIYSIEICICVRCFMVIVMISYSDVESHLFNGMTCFL